MAIPEPDVRFLTSSAQIFSSNHTLPQIRAIHKALHDQIEDKGARLRTQVGGSYRELLGTADTIVQMRGDMDTVQRQLTALSERCGRAVVGEKVAALATFGNRSATQATLSLVARAQLLESCVRTAGRLLERRRRLEQDGEPTSWGERVVLAAKVLVLSRLLLSSLGEATKETTQGRAGDTEALQASVSASKRTLGHLRRQLQETVQVIEQTASMSTARKTTAVHDVDGDRASGAAAQKDGRDDLLRALWAHSLAPTSGTRDVLWHLLHVRMQAMALAFDEEEAEEPAEAAVEERSKNYAWYGDRVVRGLALYTRTLLDVQALLPRRLPDALQALKKRPLLDDAALRGLEDLRLDVYARWCGDDVQYFTPFLQHDDLNAAQARDMLASWAERGAQVLLQGLERALAARPAHKTMHGTADGDLHAMVALRTRVLRLWLREGSKARGFDPTTLLEKMRSVFNKQLLQVLRVKVVKLRLVGAEVAMTLKTWQEGVTDRQQGLWALAAVDGNNGNGESAAEAAAAVPYVDAVRARLYGRNDAVAKAATAYATWRHVVDDAAAAVEQLQQQRWDDDAATADDDDADDDAMVVEEEETLAERQQRLGRDDPQTLYTQLQAALETAFSDLDTQLAAAWAAAVASTEQGDLAETTAVRRRGRMALYLVRVLREVRSAPPAALTTMATTTASVATSATKTPTLSLGQSLLPELHAAVARTVVGAPVDRFATTALTRTTVAGRLLWETVSLPSPSSPSSPSIALPVSPSPGAFKFLRDLSAEMAEAGVDVWTPAVVAEVRRQVLEVLGERWTGLLATAAHLQADGSCADGAEKTAKSGQTEDEGVSSMDGEANEVREDTDTHNDDVALAKTQRRDLLLQWLLDLVWLRCSLAPGSGADSDTWALTTLKEDMYARTGLGAGAEGTAVRRQLNKAAQESWRKSRLLFGLLE